MKKPIAVAIGFFVVIFISARSLNGKSYFVCLLSGGTFNTHDTVLLAPF